MGLDLGLRGSEVEGFKVQALGFRVLCFHPKPRSWDMLLMQET